MRPLPFDFLLRWILEELEGRQSIFGIHRDFFFTPRPDFPFASSRLFGQTLATPIGPAAGPHTQLAQNIVAAWLCGGRFIELKTVQIMDALEIPRPCIDMEDEGYNIEWSQELSLEQSAREYVKAWALIHILHHRLGFAEANPPGTIFNMSVGYDLKGIRSAPMTGFLERMRDASADLADIRDALRRQYPRLAGTPIPSRIADNVTLSTMHGCPPGEIEQIARYLMADRGLHTTVKLNPTLLGRQRVLGILRDDLGFGEIRVPESAFAHDLRYAEAVDLIRSLRRTAASNGLTFGVKLSNTLPAGNHKGNLPGDEMYLSGRALYPLTMNLFHRLAVEFEGGLNVSYSGGADALNVCEVLAAGALPVTVATDLLKPGGYARFGQYLENLESEMNRRGAESLHEFQRDRPAGLGRSAAEALANPRYKRNYYGGMEPKVESGLGFFDCIAAPCVEPCAVHQDVPGYARFIARGEYDRALEVVMARNPLPGVTGYICTQHCRQACTRSAGNYDQPVEIRALKRFAVERGRIALPAEREPGRRAAIIGSGPSGLAAAYFLALNGVRATVFEARAVAGGMMRLAPPFRLPTAVLQQDVDRIVGLGVELRLSQPVNRPPGELLKDGFDAVYIASGFQKDAPLYIGGLQGPGVLAALDVLRRARAGDAIELGRRVLVIGGGDTALDAARVARRLTSGSVTVVYRRTREEMPAGEEDKAGAWEEGILLEELASPTEVVRRDGLVAALACIRTELGEPDADGRRRPHPVAGSEFHIPADTIIVAVGQSPDLTFLDGSGIRLRADGSIAAREDGRLDDLPQVLAGGDAVRGPAGVIAACADGRLAAEAICRDLDIPFQTPPAPEMPLSDGEMTRIRRARARREEPCKPERTPPGMRRGLEMIEATLNEEAARREAERCLQCSRVCDKCVEVCPNRANHSYTVSPGRWIVPMLACREGELRVTGESVLHVDQSSQIVHLHDLCNDCGNCTTFCVHRGKPFQDKPRMFLRLSDFERESGDAFHMERQSGSWTIRRRREGRTAKLIMDGGTGELLFEDDVFEAALSGEDLRVVKMKLKRSFSGERTLMEAAEMAVIARGLVSSLPFLIAPDGPIG